MGDVELEAPDLEDLDEGVGPFKRAVAVAVVLITLFGAAVAYFQAVESNKEDVAARDAQREAISGLSAQVGASAGLLTDLRIGSSVDTGLQLEAINAGRVRNGENTAETDVHQAVADQHAAVAAALAALTPVDPSDPATSAADAAERNETADADRLRQTVEADLANDHGGKADAYVAVLTVLAVALFLLGLSLTVQGRTRFVLAAPGVAIALVCIGWSAFISGREITRVSETSIQEVASGRRLEEAGDLEGAIDAYGDAIDDSPDFAAAFARRASARFLQGSPQLGQTGFISVTDEDALEDALDDLDRALALGADSDVVTVSDAGFFRFLAGDFEESVRLSRQAIELNDQLAVLWFNLGVAEVALGHEDEATAAYREGRRALAALLEDEEPGKPLDFQVIEVLRGARTDLSVLRDLLDGDELDEVEDLIEEAELGLATFEFSRSVCADGAPCEAADGVDAELGDAEFSREGPFAIVEVPVDGLDEGTDVAVAWYVRTDPTFPFVQSAEGFLTTSVQDESVFSAAITSFTPLCPVAGDYLVRLYAGDEFLGEVEGTVEPSPLGGSFTAFADRVEGIEACVPEGFVVDEAELTDLDSFTSFTAPDGSFAIGVNVTPGLFSEGDDPIESARQEIEGFAPGLELFDVELEGRDIDDEPITIPGLAAVGTAADGTEVAVAIAFGPDTSSRIVLLTDAADVDLLLEVLASVTFTNVGAGTS